MWFELGEKQSVHKESWPKYNEKYLIEEKKNIQEELDKLSNEAIQQIKDRKYDYDLKGKVIYIGLAHHGKYVVMKWEEKVYI